MRLLTITQSIVFNEDVCSGLFKKGQKVTFTGHLSGYGEVVTGYLNQEPISRDGLVLYVKGHRPKYSRELVLVGTTKLTSNNSFTVCSYFPYIPDNEANGYLDETTGLISQDGKHFFIGGNYIAETHIKIEELPMLDEDFNLTQEYKKAEKKMYRMLDRLHCAKKQNNLNYGYLLDYIPPWSRNHRSLIHIYPNKPQ